MNENCSSIKNIVNYMTLFIILFIFKCLLNILLHLFSKKSDNSQNKAIFTNENPSDEIEQIKEKIVQLRIEEERLNTPSFFVEYTLIRRQKIQLERELAKKLNSKPQNLSLQNTNIAKIPLLPINLNLYSISLNILYWIINAGILISTRHVNLSLSFNKYSSNVLVNYYNEKNRDKDKVNIPLSVILFAESIALNQLTMIINKLNPLKSK